MSRLHPMSAFALLLALGVILSSAEFSRATLDSDLSDAWLEYKSKFGKRYKNPDEEAHRRKIFFENKRYIESNHTFTFTQGINHLSDMTPEELNRRRNGFRIGDSRHRTRIDNLVETLLLALNNTFEASHVNGSVNERVWSEGIINQANLDWRQSGRVSHVKDQGNCGSCWSFATTGALEGILAARGKALLLSEQNLVDCSRNYGNHGCSGGLMDAALRYVRDRGIMKAVEYPYEAREDNCRSIRGRQVMRGRGAAILPPSEHLLRLALRLMGPIPIAIDAGQRSFHSYKSGIYNDDGCSNRESSLNHAVLLVGYGTSEDGDYWLIKNSWGTDWGDKGYIKIARNRGNMCGIASYAVLPIP